MSLTISSFPARQQSLRYELTTELLYRPPYAFFTTKVAQKLKNTDTIRQTSEAFVNVHSVTLNTLALRHATVFERKFHIFSH